MEVEIDYRNGKYQGEVSINSEIRQGYGIFIDDDLSLYASNWKEGRLNGPTVIYISHGKYIYGQWHDNQPHGLNVFRIADTVVVGEFVNGHLVNNILIIFEKCNFVAILHQSATKGDWDVIESGNLQNYNDLLRYIDHADIAMKPHYFSLTKFLTSISNQRIVAIPCRNSENCYFGFQEGLGIIFNPNNGVVSVGVHSNKKLVEFGGKYEYPAYVIEGNFQTNQIIKYTNERPKNQIYSIFQKIHKKSLNFKNQYFDSKVKLLSNVEELVRKKIDQIINNKHENVLTVMDLNDSLDYHADNLEELNRINQIREEVYESGQIPMKKTTSNYVDNFAGSTKLLTPKKGRAETQPISSPVKMKKSPMKTKQRQFQRSRSRTPSRVQKSSVKVSEQSSRRMSRNYIEQSPQIQIPKLIQPYSISSKDDTLTKKYQKIVRSPISQIFPQEQKRSAGKISNFQDRQQQKQRQVKRKTIYEDIDENFIQEIERRCERTYEKSPIKQPKYQDLNERRKRLLKDFKKLNGSEIQESNNNEEEYRASNNRNIKKKEVDQSKKKVYSYADKINFTENQLESPLARENLLYFESKKAEQNSEFMPLTLRNFEQNYRRDIYEKDSKIQTAKFQINYETPTKQQYQKENREYPRADYMRGKQYLRAGEKVREEQYVPRDQYLREGAHYKGDYGRREQMPRGSIRPRDYTPQNKYKQYSPKEPEILGRAFEKKQSYKQQYRRNENTLATPNSRKAYKYYFD